jgi:NADH oxidase (H2O2-forming)
VRPHDTHIVIVGNGAAGNSAASAIRSTDKETAVTIISQEPFPEYSACTLSKKYLSGEMRREEVFLKASEDYSRDKIITIFGEQVTEIDTRGKKVILEQGEVPYDRLILATGGNAMIPPLAGVKKKGVFTLKSLADADSIFNYSGSKAVVIGAGPIGIEASISLRKRGWNVVLVELLDRVLPTMFDHEPSLLMKNGLEGFGIEVRTGERAISFEGNGHVCGVTTDKQKVECDMVILSLGIRPNVAVSKQAGIEIGSLGGIKVDEHMRTNVKDVYACGDCVETKDTITGENILCLLWYNAKQQGAIAGFNSVGIDKKFSGTITIGTVDVLGTFGVSIGHTKESFREARPKVIEGGSTWYHRILISDGVFIGAQLIGKTADIGPLVTAIRRGTRVERLQRVISDRDFLSNNPLCVKLIPYLEWACL